MILILDMDDTLYVEENYVKSGFMAVAIFGEQHFQLDTKESYLYFCDRLASDGRGKIFDSWLRKHHLFSKRILAKVVQVYRHHKPNIELTPEALSLLNFYQARIPLYLVTDGHKIAQRNKIKALQIEPYFRGIFLTHQYGIVYEKPSLYCFELIKRKERADWRDIIYVADNPKKDFVNLNKMGARTIQLITSPYYDESIPFDYQAEFKISSLSLIPNTINNL